MNSETLAEKFQRISKENEGVAEMKRRKALEGEIDKIYNRVLTYVELAAKDGNYSTKVMYPEGYNEAMENAKEKLINDGFNVKITDKTAFITRFEISWKPKCNNATEKSIENKSFFKRIFG